MNDTSKFRTPMSGVDDSARGDTRPISRIIEDILSHISEIIRSEVRLARTEVRQDLGLVARASLCLVIGGILGLYTLGFLLLAGMFGLGQAMPLWGAAIVIGVVVGVIAAILLVIGRKRLRAAHLKPEKTIETLQENVTWL